MKTEVNLLQIAHLKIRCVNGVRYCIRNCTIALDLPIELEIALDILNCISKN